MIPKDKFGNRIFYYKYKRLQENGRKLLNKGYIESKNKPNLFYRRIMNGWFYADMRGTEEVPIWQDTKPLFYWKFNVETPNWEKRRLIKRELMSLFEAHCPCRLSFYSPYSSEEFREVNSYIDEGAGIFDWDEGFCRFCGKDFRAEGSFCSRDCNLKYHDALKRPCEVCSAKIDLFKEIRHHVSYFPEKIIFVHAGCHNKIHKTDLYPYLKPSSDEINRFYRR